jgi:hypothetical protein
MANQLGSLLINPISHPDIDPAMCQMRSVTPKHARVFERRRIACSLELGQQVVFDQGVGSAERRHEPRSER